MLNNHSYKIVGLILDSGERGWLSPCEGGWKLTKSAEDAQRLIGAAARYGNFTYPELCAGEALAQIGPGRHVILDAPLPAPPNTAPARLENQSPGASGVVTTHTIRPTRFWLVTRTAAEIRKYELAAQDGPSAVETARGMAGRLRSDGRLLIGGRVELYNQDPDVKPGAPVPRALRTYGSTVHGILVDIS
jgi:hypothetical protein